MVAVSRVSGHFNSFLFVEKSPSELLHPEPPTPSPRIISTPDGDVQIPSPFIENVSYGMVSGREFKIKSRIEIIYSKLKSYTLRIIEILKK